MQRRVRGTAYFSSFLFDCRVAWSEFEMRCLNKERKENKWQWMKQRKRWGGWLEFYFPSADSDGFYCAISVPQVHLGMTCTLLYIILTQLSTLLAKSSRSFWRAGPSPPLSSSKKRSTVFSVCSYWAAGKIGFNPARYLSRVNVRFGTGGFGRSWSWERNLISQLVYLSLVPGLLCFALLGLHVQVWVIYFFIRENKSHKEFHSFFVLIIWRRKNIT